MIKWMNGWVDGWMGQCVVDRWVGGWMNGWILFVFGQPEKKCFFLIVSLH